MIFVLSRLKSSSGVTFAAGLGICFISSLAEISGVSPLSVFPEAIVPPVAISKTFFIFLIISRGKLSVNRLKIGFLRIIPVWHTVIKAQFRSGLYIYP